MPNKKFREIERKFLVIGDFKKSSHASTRIVQGYLSSLPERVVRIRIRDDVGYITIKGLSGSSMLSRFEWEKEISLDEAKELLKLCEPGIIDKTRYLIKNGKHIVEVDEFYGDNEGLIMAEIELSSENEEFNKPSWLGEEVTNDPRYYNSMLKKNPYKNW